ncbi:hypothetical protein KQI76_02295 [Amphibacillus sp. MSJ-3]|uniref:hypothetical protein n=1 Tax=Amphibacillus sp. MSJ-3 TaxID=2841505 RepID=UPI001C0ECD5B|nr:hypothetical protein [Amphibacillus sp. MSJ-3]MBU5593983.1 hypothetical protein [Amphibacillus sp. MSJ-3]
MDATHTKIDAVEAKLSEKIDAARIELKQGIEKVDKTVDLTNRKFSIVSEGLMTSQAEIRELQSVNNLL